MILGLKRIAIRGERDADRRMAYRDIGEHIGMWPKHAKLTTTFEGQPVPCLVVLEPAKDIEEFEKALAREGINTGRDSRSR